MAHHQQGSLSTQLSKLLSLPLPIPTYLPSAGRPLDSTFIAREVARTIIGRTVIVVDNSNVFQSAWPQGYRLDFGPHMFYLLGGDQLVEACFFASAPPSNAPKYDAQRGFYEFLRQAGWQVHLSQLLISENRWLENEKEVDGGVRAAVRRYATDPNVDTIVLFSGDGGMTRAVCEAVKKGKRVVALAWRNTLHSALESAASAHIYIDELQPLLERHFC